MERRLIQLVKDYIITEEDFMGLCSTTNEIRDNGIITEHERISLLTFFREHSPNRNKTFWWPMKDKQPRLDFLDMLLKKIFMEENGLGPEDMVNDITYPSGD